MLFDEPCGCVAKAVVWKLRKQGDEVADPAELLRKRCSGGLQESGLLLAPVVHESHPHADGNEKSQGDDVADEGPGGVKGGRQPAPVEKPREEHREQRSRNAKSDQGDDGGAEPGQVRSRLRRCVESVATSAFPEELGGRLVHATREDVGARFGLHLSPELLKEYREFLAIPIG